MNLWGKQKKRLIFSPSFSPVVPVPSDPDASNDCEFRYDGNTVTDGGTLDVTDNNEAVITGVITNVNPEASITFTLNGGVSSGTTGSDDATLQTDDFLYDTTNTFTFTPVNGDDGATLTMTATNEFPAGNTLGTGSCSITLNVLGMYH